MAKNLNFLHPRFPQLFRSSFSSNTKKKKAPIDNSSMLTQHDIEEVEENCKFIFKVYDSEDNGKITINEILDILRDLTDTNLVVYTPGCNKMANCCTLVPQAEIYALKDALSAQQKLLQKLYNELEAEREASATAASEALSVILRLQGEKAAVKMEAEQYKRLAEERMCHAEESFALIEDMITEKEMEVAELDYQVQTYRYQLMSMGFDVPNGDDINIPENLFQRNEFLAGETSLHQFKCKKAMFESSTSADLDFISKSVEEQLGQEINEFASDSERKADVSTHEAISSYAEQIKELEIRVKDIGGVNITGFMSESQSPSLSTRPSAANLCSLSNSANLQPETRIPSQLSVSSSYDPNKLGIVNENGQIEHPENSPKNSEAVHSPRPPTVHDVFEVPQVDEESTPYEPSNKDRQKAACQASDILESQDQSHLEAVKLIPKDEPDWLKKLLQSTHHDKNLCKPSDIAAIDRAIVQPTTSVAVAFVQPTRSVDVSESNLNRSPEISEVGQRPTESPDREEELKLLKEIREKLNLLQDEILFQKVKKFLAKDEPSLQPLAEVMISFWL